MIVVYKKHRWHTVSRDTEVILNEQHYCVLPDGAFIVIPVEGGRNTVGFTQWDTPGTSRKTLKNAKSSITYLAIDYNMGKVAGGGFGLIGMLGAEAVSEKPGIYNVEQVDKNDAVRDLKTLRRFDCPAT